MASVVSFTFNDFQENTYLVHDETKECIIFDPGCVQDYEKEALKGFIEQNGLTPVRLINTHCHLDHVFGNKFVAETYNIGLEIHEGELPVLKAVPQICAMYGLPYPEPSPMPSAFIKEGETVKFGNTELKVLYTPGHSPASISFYCEADAFLIAGDVLFQGSIGRTDLPGGDTETLLASVRNNFFTLPDNVKVFAGHGPATTVGHEKVHNPFF